MVTAPKVSPIALLRFVANMSQAELGARAERSRETISRLERGERPRLDTARAVSRALGVDITTLFPENESTPLAGGADEGAAVAGPTHGP